MNVFLILLLSWVPQNAGIDSDLFLISGLEFYSSREQIVAALGTPEYESSPEYECGFLSSDVQQVTFYSLTYPGITFTGSEKHDYLPESIDMIKANKFIITYNENRITHKTTLRQLCRILSVDLPDTNSGFQSYFTDGDDALIFSFVEDQLTTIEYWSPC